MLIDQPKVLKHRTKGQTICTELIHTRQCHCTVFTTMCCNFPVPIQSITIIQPTQTILLGNTFSVYNTKMYISQKLPSQQATLLCHCHCNAAQIASSLSSAHGIRITNFSTTSSCEKLPIATYNLDISQKVKKYTLWRTWKYCEKVKMQRRQRKSALHEKIHNNSL